MNNFVFSVQNLSYGIYFRTFGMTKKNQESENTERLAKTVNEIWYGLKFSSVSVIQNLPFENFFL